VLVVLTARGGELPAPGPLATPFRRVVRVSAAAGFRQVGSDAYEVDPADHESLASLLDAVSGPGGGRVDWLHALPLSVGGPVSDRTLALARWACLDTPAALLRAADGRPGLALRPWWLSCGAQPVEGEVRRPELGLLAGISAVGPQECAAVGHWLDLPDPDPARWTAAVAGLLEAADPDRLPARLALVRGYWWYQALLPLAGDDAGFSGPAELAGDGVHVVLGGTGGIGRTVAGWLLKHSDGPVILVARGSQRSPGLDQWADRVEVVQADLAAEAAEAIAGRIEQAARRLVPDHAGIVTVVHAAGTASGGMIVRRDAASAASVSAAKLGGLLVAEELIVRHRPALALYCSSMSAQLGGLGQVDYAAANGALDGFARYRAGENDPTLRVSVGWDVWREAGMARAALAGNARHQAHLAVGLTLDEARRVLGRVVRLRLPQVLVSVTDLETSAAFYGPEMAAESGPELRPGATAESLEYHLSACLRQWLGVDELDPAASLYDLGADSLTLVDLIAEIRDRTGTDLLLSQFTHEVSLAEVLMLAAETREAGDDQVTIEIWQEGTGPAGRQASGHDLVCLLHPVGGDLLAYRALVAAIDDRLTVCLIADPGLSAPAPPDWTLAERARRYHAALAARFPDAHWRWRLAGWSFGAWVAVAMAAEAEAAGHPAEAVVLIDPPAPDAGSRLAAYDDARLETVFATELGGSRARDYAERLARCGRASLASMDGYVPPVLATTPGWIWFAATPTPGLPAPEPADERARRWRTHLPARAEWRAIDTTHDGIVREPHAAVIGAEISAAIQPALWVA
jgi:thioesterase domain-containing protein/NAD(P)-dependent dehydrogenase (short-subunit alcohol dehydrogenase family)/acyl carrier protein